MRVKRPVIIPHSRLRGGVTAASASSLHTSYCALLHFPSKNIPINTASPSTFKNIYIFKILYFENFLLPFFGALGTLDHIFEPPQVLPRLYPTFPYNATHTPPWKNTHEKVESPRLTIIDPLLVVCVCWLSRTVGRHSLQFSPFRPNVSEGVPSNIIHALDVMQLT